MEDQTSSCTCSGASPFSCTCPRADPPLLPNPLIYDLNYNSGVRESENTVTASDSSNVEYTQRSHVGFMIPPVARPLPRPLTLPLQRAPPLPLQGALPRPLPLQQSLPLPRPVDRPLRLPPPLNPPLARPVARPVERYIGHWPEERYIGELDPPLLPTTDLIYAFKHNSGVPESASIVRASEPGTSNVEYVQIPEVSVPPGLRPVTRYFGDTIGGWVRMQDGRSVGVSQEFWSWAIGRKLSEVQNEIMADYRDLERMHLLLIIN